MPVVPSGPLVLGLVGGRDRVEGRVQVASYFGTKDQQPDQCPSGLHGAQRFHGHGTGLIEWWGVRGGHSVSTFGRFLGRLVNSGLGLAGRGNVASKLFTTRHLGSRCVGVFVFAVGRRSCCRGPVALHVLYYPGRQTIFCWVPVAGQ